MKRASAACSLFSRTRPAAAPPPSAASSSGAVPIVRYRPSPTPTDCVCSRARSARPCHLHAGRGETNCSRPVGSLWQHAHNALNHQHGCWVHFPCTESQSNPDKEHRFKAGRSAAWLKQPPPGSLLLGQAGRELEAGRTGTARLSKPAEQLRGLAVCGVRSGLFLLDIR